jgi:hypothetical protein
MPQAPECKMCGGLMELQTVRAPHPADDQHLFRCPHCHHVVKAIPTCHRLSRRGRFTILLHFRHPIARWTKSL